MGGDNFPVLFSIDKNVMSASMTCSVFYFGFLVIFTIEMESVLYHTLEPPGGASYRKQYKCKFIFSFSDDEYTFRRSGFRAGFRSEM